MSSPGYYRFPAIHDDTVVFTSEDDLWTVSATGGIARRLTANLGTISHPHFSPDGRTLAFTGREEGHSEVYTMPAEGGPVHRVTYLGVTSTVLGWTPDGTKILFSTDAKQAFDRIGWVQSVSPEGGLPDSYPVGPAVSISIGEGGRTVIGRNNNDPARWKRYRGGTAGDIWIDAEGGGSFRRLLNLKGNVARPMWFGDRIIFLSDHEGIGNLYSCTTDGADIQQLTQRDDFFVRFPNTDGKRIVYHAGGDLFIFDPADNTDRRVEVVYHSPRVPLQRRFVEAAKYLGGYSLHPKGHSLALNVRGKSFTLGNFEGPVLQQGGEFSPVRYRMTSWLNDGERVVSVLDEGGIDHLEVFKPLSSDPSVRIDGLDIGRPTRIAISPTADHVALSNHRNELLFIDLEAKSIQVCDRSPAGNINGMDWSPDGRWLAYGFATNAYATELRLWDRTTGETHTITEPVLHDMDPAFDPEGKYLYFLAMRDLKPVYDRLHFDLGFPKGVRPYLLTLRADLPSPFILTPGSGADDSSEKKDEGKGEDKEDGKEDGKENSEESSSDTEKSEGEDNRKASSEAGVYNTAVAKKDDKKKPEPVLIDLEGIARRVLAFPVPEGIYGQIAGLKGKALFTSYPVESALAERTGETGPNGTLEVFDFKDLKHDTLINGVSEFDLSHDRKMLLYRAGRKLRVVKAGEKPDEKGGGEPGRKSGYVDLKRIKVSVEPGVEWQQMAREAWRLQREYFWTEDMSQIDWDQVWERYSPLIDRLGTRGEFSDLLWEMQGELGTSHAYEMGGDYRTEPSYPQGFLGADYAFDPIADDYRITRIVQGTAGESRADSPLNGPGINVKVGDKLKAVNGKRVGRTVTPQFLLVHQADSEVTLTVEDAEGKARDVVVKTLRSEFGARYREWVEDNRRHVHEATGGRIGYVHIPDMGANGYAEFHRLYLSEVSRDGMIVDVRYNRGGHVSQLLIEKLARKRVGYDISRWGQPDPYPNFSVGGPMVALTNQFAGSDGDIFSHVFKLMKLGPLIGKRTWGGVIGISPRNPLADGAVTTQPEYSFWFEDVGWGVENYGTDPDIDIDITPQDYVRGDDPQMAKALALILEELQRNPPVRPSFADRPNLSLPGSPRKPSA